MFNRAMYLAVLLAILCLPAYSAQRNIPGDISGDYEASVMGSRIEASIQQNGDEIKGVAHVFSGRKKNTYHFDGQIQGSLIQVVHYSGHSFTGNVTPGGDLVGVLRTSGGHRISVHASRR